MVQRFIKIKTFEKCAKGFVHCPNFADVSIFLCHWPGVSNFKWIYHTTQNTWACPWNRYNSMNLILPFLRECNHIQGSKWEKNIVSQNVWQENEAMNQLQAIFCTSAIESFKNQKPFVDISYISKKMIVFNFVFKKNWPQTSKT